MRGGKLLYKAVILAILVAVMTFCMPEVRPEASFSSMEGIASWYSEFSPGVLPTTANMEKFNHNTMTCASWDFPFNTVLEVTNVINGRKVIVRVNDRGPAKRLYNDGRIIDLTMAAFARIADLDMGLVPVEVRVVFMGQ